MHSGFMEVLARFDHARSDPARAKTLPALFAVHAYPAKLAESLGFHGRTSPTAWPCLRGCGLVVTMHDGWRRRYELAAGWLGHAVAGLLGVALSVEPEPYSRGQLPHLNIPAFASRHHGSHTGE